MEISSQLKENRKSIALDAASLGRLTRLQEEVVERTADAKQHHETSRDAWTLKRASETAMLKSSFHRCVQEAAVVGLLQRHDVVEVVSTPKNDTTSSTSSSSSIVPNKSLSPPAQDEELGASMHRASQVLEEHVQVAQKEKARSWKSSLAMLEHLDREEETRRAWLEHQECSSTTHSAAASCRSSLSPLPSPVVPRWHKRVSGMTKYKLIECISQEAANQAFERAWRLENASEHELIVRKGCTCVYCSGNPSPYQTQEYQRLQKRNMSAFTSFVDLDDDDLSSVGSASVLDHSSHSRVPNSYLSKVNQMDSRAPRSLTPPRRTAQTAKITKRWSSTPMPSSTTTSQPSPPSWVSPIGNRKHINFKKNTNMRASLPTPTSPCGVSSVIVLERESLDRLKLDTDVQKRSSSRTSPPARKSLDGELDEEQLLREELVSLGIANDV